MGLGQTSLQAPPIGHDCNGCGSSNAWNRNYCRSCGSALTRACAGCHFANGLPDHFCGGCGNQLALAEHPAIGTPAPPPKASQPLRPQAPAKAALRPPGKASASSPIDLAMRLQKINAAEVKVKAPPLPLAAQNKSGDEKSKDDMEQDQIDDLFG